MGGGDNVAAVAVQKWETSQQGEIHGEEWEDFIVSRGGFYSEISEDLVARSWSELIGYHEEEHETTVLWNGQLEELCKYKWIAVQVEDELWGDLMQLLWTLRVDCPVLMDSVGGSIGGTVLIYMLGLMLYEVEIRNWAAESLLELEPQNPAIYISLLSMYSAKGEGQGDSVFST
ncbi:hypothetical protein F0562_032179 [Nyssa sinensis]|uniref:Uncharacterized protein n=1 Tax=Nyssa sinensis TaxID=561372 RepID=A0A5J5AY11_9ASTE|nr:hypothetical protein F0562_032179 [Nyssa sinensis]